MSDPSPREDCTVPAGDLLRFAAGEAGGAQRRRILEHILAGCPRCRESLDALRELRHDTSAAQDEPELPSISGILAGLGERAARIDRERAEARNLLRDFVRHPVARQWTLVRNSHRFDTWSFCAGLIEVSFEAIYDDPRRSVELAQMAHEIAERLDPGPYGERAVLDLRGRASAHVGNARRALGDLGGADDCLRRARALLEEGTGDPLDEAELLYYEASLLRARRELEPALRKARRSVRLYRELGDHHLEGRSLVNEGTIEILRGNLEQAGRCYRDALEMVEQERDRHLFLTVRHNFAWWLMESGNGAAALEQVESFRGDYEALGDRTLVLRLHWLEGRILHRLARTDEAAKALSAAIDGFAEAELPYEVANTSLDLALIHAESNRFAEVRRVASETLVLFRALGVEREAIAAWLVFEQAAEAQAVTVALIERLARYYTEAKLRPDLRFEG
jgi:tetratricopeptide (TPR) repeat protein